MFKLPEATLYNKKIPKNKFYEKLKAGKRLKEMFINQVEKIVWKHKISKDTVNIEPTKEIPEIQIFEVHLKKKELSKEILENIDRAVPYPVLFLLIYDKEARCAVSFKKPSKKKQERYVVEQYFFSDWKKANEISFDFLKGLNLKTVYENVIKNLIPEEEIDSKNLEEVVERQKIAEKLRGEIELIESRVNKEVHFKRKVKLNLKLQQKQKELQQLWIKEDKDGQPKNEL